MYRVLRVDDPSFTDRHWRAYYRLFEELQDKYSSDFSRDGWETLRDRTLSRFQLQTGQNQLAVLAADRMVGWVSLRIIDLGTPYRQGLLTMDTLLEPVPSGFVQVCAPVLAKILTEAGCDHALLLGVTLRADDFGRLLGGERLGWIEKFRLLRNKANVATIDRWLTEIPRQHSGLSLELFEYVPEEHQVRFAELMGQFVNDMPTASERKTAHTFTVEELRGQEAWRRRNNVHLYTFALIDRGQLAAFSNARINGASARHIRQLMTGVDRAYRGRGLAKWLKAAMFRRVGEDFPENVSLYTDMREVNAPIQHINAQMGYVLESRGGEYHVTVDELLRVK